MFLIDPRGESLVTDRSPAWRQARYLTFDQGEPTWLQVMVKDPGGEDQVNNSDESRPSLLLAHPFVRRGQHWSQPHLATAAPWTFTLIPG